MIPTEITILTGKFIKFETDNENNEKVVIDVRLNQNVIQTRLFDKILVEDIKNLKNVLIGITTQPGRMTITFINGNRYYKLFEECGWEVNEEEKINNNRRKKLKEIINNNITL